MVDVRVMSNLRFAYASDRGTSLPTEVAQALPTRNWQVSRLTLNDAQRLDTLPDFTWLDLGQKGISARWWALIRRLAELRPAAGKHYTVFISGRTPEIVKRDAAVRLILRSFSDPASLEIDLKGQPDVRTAILKFTAIHQARQGSNEGTPVSAPATPMRVPNADLRTERGRLSIKLIADLFGLPMVEIGRLIGRPQKAALSKTPDAESLQSLLQPFADIALLRSPEFDDNAFRMWLRTPHVQMQNRTPIDWIREGRVRDVGGFVHGILTGQPS